ncbi:MAG TPA: carbamoyltransferase C-terminal domain-containing protein [Hyphomicrobiaceae bacterium]|nr:carbamoyltransferase C-terminal domain-containing protein [Hyphomicrobiaceae bacterium]
MRVLGIVSETHDSGIAVVKDGRPEIVIEEERFSRVKRTKAFPAAALSAAFQDRGFGIDMVDAIALPWNIGALRRTAAWAVARRFPASLNLLHARAHRPQRNQIVVLQHRIRDGLQAHFRTRRIPPIFQVGHHDAHAAAFFVSPFEEALVVVMDGYGDDASASVYLGRGNRLERVWSTGIFNSLGLVYTFVTEHLGFEGFGDEGKVMALAAYGSDRLVASFRDVVKPQDDGTYKVDMSYFSYDTYGQIRPMREKFIRMFGPARRRDEPLSDHHRDLARALQVVTEETVLRLVSTFRKRYGARNVVLAGGVALNCVANGRVLAESGVERLWVPPCASDTGAPLGAALWHTHQVRGLPRSYELTNAYLGASFKADDIEAALGAQGIESEEMPDAALVGRVARDLSDGRIVGWYQGRFEMGPRALGNRSILADPRSAAMRDTINRVIKKRESFRPFAPAVPEERAAEFFEITQPDPFMTLAPRVRPEKRSLIEAAVHVDGTGRIQTVSAKDNPLYHALLVEFGRLTGVPVLINTSFNEQEPIVARPEEAIACFKRTDMDVLVLGNHYVSRHQRAGAGDMNRSVDNVAVLPINGKAARSVSREGGRTS